MSFNYLSILSIYREGECYLAMGNGEKALQIYMDASKQIRGSKQATMQLKHQIQVWL